MGFRGVLLSVSVLDSCFEFMTMKDASLPMRVLMNPKSRLLTNNEINLVRREILKRALTPQWLLRDRKTGRPLCPGMILRQLKMNTYQPKDEKRSAFATSAEAQPRHTSLLTRYKTVMNSAFLHDEVDQFPGLGGFDAWAAKILGNRIARWTAKKKATGPRAAARDLPWVMQFTASDTSYAYAP